ncbi:MAG: DUF1491 family protein [Rhodobacteraceae bacterium]|nr:DUF1491 family protein [Paracoccaceae bacterium]
MSARLASAFWVQAYLTRLRVQLIPAFVTAHGDDTSGAVLVKLNTLDGKARIFARRFDLLTDTRIWDVVFDGPETDADAVITRERTVDADVWVIEVEDREGRHLLDEEGLA